ncbi:MAG TPA: crossover junction endodeoxyribonuclease RuvC [Candidatus Brocadiia bacterium]|nr:crossover junction endodeoxyribonuclease RuvC [Planctomycetota bacterium]MDO8093655.1 crossover junction endodeoxyribonuclease RuvC [Candidatus Brocadiales bacterium]
MRILGIDTGTQIAGYGIVDTLVGGRLHAVDYGIIRASAKDTFPLRLKSIYEGLTNVIKKHRPDHVALEEIFYGKNVRAALRIGEGRGIALLSAASANLPVSEYAATVVKKAVVGSGNAHKSQVQAMVKIILNLSELPKPFDAADALAIAICHSHHLKIVDSKQ